MAYDRYDTRNPRDERSRWSNDRNEDRGRGGRDDRGFFERASDEVASWFGDDDAERRRREDQSRDGSMESYGRGSGRDRDRERMGSRDRDWNERMSRDHDQDRSRNRDRERSWYETRGTNERGGYSESDYNPSWRRDLWGGDRERGSFQRDDRDSGHGYRPMTGDYSRSEEFFAASGVGTGERAFGDYDRSDRDRSQSEWGRDPYRRTSRAGTADRSDRSRHEDPNYDSWRQRHMSDLDRDYDEYRREHQSRFEDEFASWRDTRQQKRSLLGQIREHMEVVGNDDQHVGKIDKVAGDRVILAKSDPESGGAHHSLSCSDIDRVEGDRVILDCSADQARNRWRDENRHRALFERDDQGEMGPRALDRSFEGTYRR